MNDLIHAQALPVADVLSRFRVAQTMRQPWENIWNDCTDYTLPYSQSAYGGLQRNTKLYDGTAGDSVDQLASSLLAQLTPPWSSWIGMVPGPQASEKEIAYLTPLLQEANEILQGHFDRSNFTVEMHQAFLDLVTYGTACLRFDETEPGALSAFQFHTTKLNAIYFLDSARGQLETGFCLLEFSSEELLARFPQACSCLEENKGEEKHQVLYAICQRIARRALNGVLPDQTFGADHYHEASIHPSWAEGRVPTIVIGHHVFYQLEK